LRLKDSPINAMIAHAGIDMLSRLTRPLLALHDSAEIVQPYDVELSRRRL
jgi:hypothetical protein